VAQLRLKISQDFEKLEPLMLTEVDKLVSRLAQIGRQHLIAVRVCLWNLIFAYRDHMIHIHAFSYSQGGKNSQHLHQVVATFADL